MCDYCVTHSTQGKKWYLNARNYSKELARSEFVKNFCELYFSTQIKPGIYGKTSTSNFEKKRRISLEKKNEITSYYQKYLHHQVITSAEAISVIDIASNATDDHAKTIVHIPCICRYRTYGSDSNLHCLGIAFTPEYTRKFPDYLGGEHKYVSPTEAIDFVENLGENQSIVHTISALGVPYLGLICNCDMNVCIPFKHRIQYNIASPIYKGHHRSIVDEQKCIGCGNCVDVCPFDVPILDPNTETVKINLNDCFGCGICIKHCPENAIQLKELKDISEY